MSVLSDILSGVGGSQGVASGAAQIISAVKGTPQTVNYVTTAPTTGTISPTLLIGGGVVLFLVLFMVLKHE